MSHSLKSSAHRASRQIVWTAALASLAFAAAGPRSAVGQEQLVAGTAASTSSAPGTAAASQKAERLRQILTRLDHYEAAPAPAPAAPPAPLLDRLLDGASKLAMRVAIRLGLMTPPRPAPIVVPPPSADPSHDQASLEMPAGSPAPLIGSGADGNPVGMDSPPPLLPPAPPSADAPADNAAAASQPAPAPAPEPANLAYVAPVAEAPADQAPPAPAPRVAPRPALQQSPAPLMARNASLLQLHPSRLRITASTVQSHAFNSLAESALGDRLSTYSN